jgi:hypothetical protein
MLKALLGGVVALMLLLPTVSSLEACGDRLLALSFGNPFPNTPAEHPAHILHYTKSEKFAQSGPIPVSKLQSILGPMGHTLDTASSPDEFREKLDSGKYTAVLIDPAEAQRLAKMIQSSGSQPAVIPFVFNGTKEERSRVRKEYGVVLKAPVTSISDLRDTIDDAMGNRDRDRKNAQKLAKQAYRVQPK